MSEIKQIVSDLVNMLPLGLKPFYVCSLIHIDLHFSILDTISVGLELSCVLNDTNLIPKELTTGVWGFGKWQVRLIGNHRVNLLEVSVNRTLYSAIKVYQRELSYMCEQTIN